MSGLPPTDKTPTVSVYFSITMVRLHDEGSYINLHFILVHHYPGNLHGSGDSKGAPPGKNCIILVLISGHLKEGGWKTYSKYIE